MYHTTNQQPFEFASQKQNGQGQFARPVSPHSPASLGNESLYSQHPQQSYTQTQLPPQQQQTYHKYNMNPGSPTLPSNQQTGIIRSANSSVGSRSIRSSASRTSRVLEEAPAILNDRSIAPPPRRPDILNTLSPDALARLPNYDKIQHSGDCLARLSLRTMLIKRWRPTFWIAFGDHQILFFRTRNDFHEWATNPYITDEHRDDLVKVHIDFKNHVRLENLLGYKVSQITAKRYRSSNGFMNQFKLDKWYTYGPSVSAAVGSKNDIELRNIRRIMTAMMAVYPQSVNADFDEDDQYDDGSARSSLSGISKYSCASANSVISSRSAYSPNGPYPQTQQGVPASTTQSLIPYENGAAQSQYNLGPQQIPTAQQAMGSPSPSVYDSPPAVTQPARHSVSVAVSTSSQHYYNLATPDVHSSPSATTVTPPRQTFGGPTTQQPYHYDLGTAQTPPGRGNSNTHSSRNMYTTSPSLNGQQHANQVAYYGE